MFRSGFVAIVGSPNAGKSSLINKIFSRKISIVSDKVQTTRDMIKGIYNDENHQIIFLDTPGFHKPDNKLQVYMNNQIEYALSQVDLIIYVLDAKYGLGKKEEVNIKRIKQEKGCKKICLINKIDLINHTDVIKLVHEVEELNLFDQVFAISIKNGFDVDSFINDIGSYLTDDMKYYDDDQLVDYSNQFYVEEIIREKINNYCFDEIPHSVAIKVAEMIEEDNLLNIYVDIYVERDSQKGIIIGKGGSQIKKIGQEARTELKRYFNQQIYLDIHVKVLKNWNQKERDLLNLGYEDL